MVKPNQTIQLLKQLDYQKEKIYSKLKNWELALAEDELVFEDPVENFLLQKMLRFDIEKFMIHPNLRHKFKKTVRVPNNKELQKAAYMIHAMADFYRWNFSQEIDSFGNFFFSKKTFSYF